MRNCMVQGLSGPLMYWSDEQWRDYAKLAGDDWTGESVKRYFLDKYGEGYRSIPMGDCDNHDKIKGCLGHED